LADRLLNLLICPPVGIPSEASGFLVRATGLSQDISGVRAEGLLETGGHL